MQINDRYEFPEELDLDIEDGKYLSENADRTVRNNYRLHSVLVHSGTINGGHYYAYCNPTGNQWLKFDDEKVLPSSRARHGMSYKNRNTFKSTFKYSAKFTCKLFAMLRLLCLFCSQQKPAPHPRPPV